MHPIEHLRALARTGDLDASWLIPEAAQALSGLCDDRNALVMACRTLLAHLGVCGPLWWLCGSALTARDPVRALGDLVDEFFGDPTPLQLSLALTDVSDDDLGQPRIVDALIAGASGAVVDPETMARASGDTAKAPIWVTVGLGVLVPDRILTAVDPQRQGRSFERLSPGMIARVIRPTQVGDAALLGGRPDVGFVPELLTRG